MNALEELAKWDRKYYSYTIQTSRHIQPGDGLNVILNGGGRTVSVNEIDLEKWETVDEERYENTFCPTINDVILEAIRLWHADDSVKNYRAIWVFNKQRGSIPEYNNVEGIKIESVYNNEISMMFEARFQATNEAEALQKMQSCYPVGYNVNFSIWEVDKNFNR